MYKLLRFLLIAALSSAVVSKSEPMTSLNQAYTGGMCGDGTTTFTKDDIRQHNNYVNDMAEAEPNNPLWKSKTTLWKRIIGWWKKLTSCWSNGVTETDLFR